jgi:acyl-[acyl-carrier-protein] desaturase
MHQVTKGFDAGMRGETLTDGLVYLTFQELATRISHWNTGRFLDSVGTTVMRRVAADENLHFLFYRDLASTALAADPSGTVKAIERQVTNFEMPGTGIDGFAAHAASIAAIGIYDYRVHYEQVLAPVVTTHWQVEELVGLDADAQRARDRLLARMARIRRVSERIASQSQVTLSSEDAPAERVHVARPAGDLERLRR